MGYYDRFGNVSRQGKPGAMSGVTPEERARWEYEAGGRGPLTDREVENYFLKNEIESTAPAGRGGFEANNEVSQRLQQLEVVLGEDSINRASAYFQEKMGRAPSYSEVMGVLEAEYKRQISLKGPQIQDLVAQGLDPAEAEAQVFLAERINRML